MTPSVIPGNYTTLTDTTVLGRDDASTGNWNDRRSGVPDHLTRRHHQTDWQPL